MAAASSSSAASSGDHHVHCICIVRRPKAGEDAVIVAMQEDLTEFNFFTRGGVRQGLVFGVRTVMSRVGPGISRVSHDNVLCQNYVSAAGIGVSVVTTTKYPARVGVSLAQQLCDQFTTEIGAAAWGAAAEFSLDSWAPLKDAIAKFQDPVKADSLLRVRAKLDATKESLCQTIDQVLKRGEKLDDLLDASKDLTEASKGFYRKARQTDSCCAVC